MLTCVAVAACGRADDATSPQATVATADERPSMPTGRIRGVVTLRGNPPPGRSEPVTQQQAVCGTSVSVTRLALGPDNGVKRAIVYLEGVEADRRVANPPPPLVIEQRDCRYVPGTLLVTPGTPIEIVNDDPVLHNVHARENTDAGLRTVFNIAQPIRGQRTPVTVPLERPGVVELSCEAGHPWMSAFMLVSGHSYAALTDDRGEFVIDAVPVGTYPITMWHQGVALVRVIPSLQRFEYEPPYKLIQQAVVRQNEETVVRFELELHPRSEAAN
jgi:plastocyanin